MTALRDERLQLRVNAAAKRRIEDAAEQMHVSLSAFVLQAAQQQADMVLAERETIRLSPEAATAFEEALTRPARVNRRLAEALQRPAKFIWID
jgi:uncharacterized protein (DUF1778 family)